MTPPLGLLRWCPLSPLLLLLPPQTHLQVLLLHKSFPSPAPLSMPVIHCPRHPLAFLQAFPVCVAFSTRQKPSLLRVDDPTAKFSWGFLLLLLLLFLFIFFILSYLILFYFLLAIRHHSIIISATSPSSTIVLCHRWLQTQLGRASSANVPLATLWFCFYIYLLCFSS